MGSTLGRGNDMAKLDYKQKQARHRKAFDPWEDLDFAAVEALLREHYGVRGEPGVTVKLIKDAAGNLIGHKITGALSKHGRH